MTGEGTPGWELLSSDWRRDGSGRSVLRMAGCVSVGRQVAITPTTSTGRGHSQERPERGARARAGVPQATQAQGQRSCDTRHDSSVGTTATSYFPKKRKWRPGRTGFTEELTACISAWGARGPW